MCLTIKRRLLTIKIRFLTIKRRVLTAEDKQRRIIKLQVNKALF
jgi:hypothetical protein